jgi:hypothetical protein
MPRPFYQATAEQVVVVSEAIVSLGNSDVAAVAAFTDLPTVTADGALRLAVDMNLLIDNSGTFSIGSPLCRLLRTPQDREKAAILRVALESYVPFQVFREEHDATGNVSDAAQRTKVKLDLDCHREEIKATLLSLATYSGALTPGQGNNYSRDAQGLTSLLDELVAGSREIADATQTIRHELGADVGLVDHTLVIQPLVAGLRHAVAGAGREAVLQAGIAIENFLISVATHHGTNIVGASGINSKMERLKNAALYPGKLHNICKYLGHVRNAADHGADAEIAAPWDVSVQTGRNYVFVAAMFIRAMLAHRLGRHDL